MPNLSLATGVAVWLGLFCGLAWVSGYTLLQENVDDEFRGRTFASLTVLSRLGLFLSLTLFPVLSSVYGAKHSSSSSTQNVHGSISRDAARAVDGRGASRWRRASTRGGSFSGTGSPARNPSRSCRS